MYSFVLYESKCTNDCVFCDSKEMGNINQNIKSEFLKIDQIISNGNKIDVIEISGNDPAEYLHLPDLVKKIKLKTRAKKIILTTHGKTLKEINFIEELVKAGATDFTIALYGHNQLVHDAVTNCKGSFEATFEGLINLATLNQKFKITTLITRENQDYLKQMFSFFSMITNQITVGIPCYIQGSRFKKHIPDLLKFQKDIMDLLNNSLNKYMQITFKDIPFCLLGMYYGNVINSSIPEEGYMHWGKNEKNKYSIQKINGKNIPLYRLLDKQVQCYDCKYFKDCHGFYQTYLYEKLFVLKPFKK